MTNSLKEFSEALAAQTQAARAFTAEIRMGHSSHRSGTLWRADVAVTSEQSLPKAESYQVTVAGSEPVQAALAGRDPGTNVALLKLDKPLAGALPAAAEAPPGAIALAFGADGHGGIAARLGLVSSVGPEWRSRAGGKIDRRITLDLSLSHREDGGPVVDAQGRLLGISTLGYGDIVLAIPPSTVERSVEHLLAHGSVERGWLGVALQPVAIPDAWRETAAEKTGLMVMSTSDGGPAAVAGMLPGDILLTIEGARACHVRELSERLGSDSVGREVELGLLRAGARVSLRATIATRPASG
jgi:S1-C subfamily serine protease